MFGDERTHSLVMLRNISAATYRGIISEFFSPCSLNKNQSVLYSLRCYDNPQLKAVFKL